jgi:hypothetical protein
MINVVVVFDLWIPKGVDGCSHDDRWGAIVGSQGISYTKLIIALKVWLFER